jgi:hypothetical protein
MTEGQSKVQALAHDAAQDAAHDAAPDAAHDAAQDASTPCPQGQSPGFGSTAGLGDAYELKFQLTPAEASTIEAWAREHLNPDAHGDNGSYRITSIYCDTASLDVFHRSPGFRRHKHRLRCYDGNPTVYLERKSKRGDLVRKKRVEIAPDELPLLGETVTPETWSGVWFHRRVQKRALQPTCLIAYHRTAFFGWSNETPLRLTLDTNLRGAKANGWEVPRLQEGQPLLPGSVLLELKFHLAMPDLFRQLLPLLPLQTARASKYRRCVELCVLNGERNGHAGNGVHLNGHASSATNGMQIPRNDAS